MSDADKPAAACNVVRFGNLAKPPQAQGADVNRERASIDATGAVARLSLLGRLEYERARCKAAKELGCRVSFLDRVIENIREAVSQFKHELLNSYGAFRLRSFARDERVSYMGFHSGPTVTPAWQLASAQEVETGDTINLVLLADGNFTVARGRERASRRLTTSTPK